MNNDDCEVLGTDEMGAIILSAMAGGLVPKELFDRVEALHYRMRGMRQHEGPESAPILIMQVAPRAVWLAALVGNVIRNQQLVPGYYRVRGLSDGYGEFWRVKRHCDALVNNGEPYDCAWGLSLWGAERFGVDTWAYRTFGNRLAVLVERFPNAKWEPDHDRVPERANLRVLRGQPAEQEEPA